MEKGLGVNVNFNVELVRILLHLGRCATNLDDMTSLIGAKK